jgi:hypothetical protein
MPRNSMQLIEIIICVCSTAQVTVVTFLLKKTVPLLNTFKNKHRVLLSLYYFLELLAIGLFQFILIFKIVGYISVIIYFYIIIHCNQV